MIRSRLLETEAVMNTIKQEVADSNISVKVKWSSIEHLLNRPIPYEEKVAFIRKFGFELKLLTIFSWLAGASSIVSNLSTITIAPIGAAQLLAGNIATGKMLIGINILTTVFEIAYIFIYILYRTSFYIRFKNTSAETEEEVRTLRGYIRKYFFQGRGIATFKLAVPITLKLIKDMFNAVIEKLDNFTSKFAKVVSENLRLSKIIFSFIMILAIILALINI